jgi:hypothetical protein
MFGAIVQVCWYEGGSFRPSRATPGKINMSGHVYTLTELATALNKDAAEDGDTAVLYQVLTQAHMEHNTEDAEMWETFIESSGAGFADEVSRLACEWWDDFAAVYKEEEAEEDEETEAVEGNA